MIRYNEIYAHNCIEIPRGSLNFKMLGLQCLITPSRTDNRLPTVKLSKAQVLLAFRPTSAYPTHLSRRTDKLNKSDAAWAIEGVPIETNPNLNIYKLKYFIEPFFHKFKKLALHILHLRDWLITWPFLIDESAIAP